MADYRVWCYVEVIWEGEAQFELVEDSLCPIGPHFATEADAQKLVKRIRRAHDPRGLVQTVSYDVLGNYVTETIGQ
jgi:hypothetical protein